MTPFDEAAITLGAAGLILSLLTSLLCLPLARKLATSVRVSPGRAEALAGALLLAPWGAWLGVLLLWALHSEPILLEGWLHGGEGHGHTTHGGVPLFAVVVALAGVIGVALWYACSWLAVARIGTRASKLRRALEESSEVGAASGFSRVRGDSTLCATAGFLSPRAFISERVLDALGPDCAEVVAIHELEHVRRRDPLRRFVAMILSVVHLPRVRREILRGLSLAQERACDEAAAQQKGDPLLVAEALLRVGRLGLHAAPPLGGLVCAAAHEHLILRTEALITPAERDLARTSLLLAATLASLPVALTLLLHHPVVHHAVASCCTH